MNLSAILDRVRGLLTGEPVRAITYGAIVVVWLVTHLAFAAGWIATPPPGFDVILAAVSAAIAGINEVVRSLVYSPNTADRLVATAQAFGASQAGVPPSPPTLSASDIAPPP